MTARWLGERTAFDAAVAALGLGHEAVETAWLIWRARAGLQREPAAQKPYAYEFGRSNGDGTYTVVIERGSLVQTGMNRWDYGPPKDPHKDWPVKPLYEHPPAGVMASDLTHNPKLREELAKQAHAASGDTTAWADLEPSQRDHWRIEATSGVPPSDGGQQG